MSFAVFENLPAPSAGINAVSNFAEMQPTEALYAYNVIMTQGGPTVRPGYTQWAGNMSGTAGGVRTMIAVRGAGSAGAQDFLFAVSIAGIWNVTYSATSPALVVAFANQTGYAGYCEWEHFTNLNGDVCLLVCDEVNGYYTFDTSTSTWLQVTQGAGASQISGVNPALFASVRVFNNQVWFVQAGTGNAWYLPTAQIYGTVTQFDWGNRFPHGGNLNNLYIFTYGSYLGTYTYLVAIGDAGDVLAYSGNNPNSAATWTLSGQWYVGDMPLGRRTASNYGGDLNIICAYGVLQLSSLFFQKNTNDPALYLTKKIAPAIAADIQTYGALYRGFGFVSWPSQNSLVLTEPVIYNPATGAATFTRQYCYNLATNAWSILSGLNWQHAAYWHGNVYAGTSDGNVIKMTGNQDNILLNGTPGIAINFGVLGAFIPSKNSTNQIVDLITAYFSTDSPVSYQTFVRYDFDISDLMLGSVSYTAPATSGGWDSGLWDSAIWGGNNVAAPQFSNYGATPGMGKYVAIGCLGASTGNTKLIGYALSGRPTTGFL